MVKANASTLLHHHHHPRSRASQKSFSDRKECILDRVISFKKKKKKIEHLIYGDHNYGARKAPRPPEGNHWHPEGCHFFLAITLRIKLHILNQSTTDYLCESFVPVLLPFDIQNFLIFFLKVVE